MQKTLINSATNEWVNSIALPDDWVGAESEWQLPPGHELVDGNGGPDHVWNGIQFDNPNQITEEEQTEIYWASLRTERDALLASSDWTQYNDSPLDDEAKADWAVYRQKLRDLPASTEDPANPTWPDAP